MIEKRQRKSIRLKEYDYSQPGDYFITICTQGKQCYFGEVVEEVVRLSPIGVIAKQCWEEIPKHFPNTESDVFVIMPNHIHGILVLDEPVGTRHAVSLQERFGKPVTGSVPTIVRSFKSAVTNLCRQNGYSEFQWQSKYYEHIVRNDKDLNNIRDYIINNPIKWLYDEENLNKVK